MVWMDLIWNLEFLAKRHHKYPHLWQISPNLEQYISNIFAWHWIVINMCFNILYCARITDCKVVGTACSSLIATIHDHRVTFKKTEMIHINSVWSWKSNRIQVNGPLIKLYYIQTRFKFSNGHGDHQFWGRSRTTSILKITNSEDCTTLLEACMPSSV